MIQKTTYKHPYLWISPDGDFYDGTAHESSARELLKELYDIDMDCLGYCGDALVSAGWIKVNPELNSYYEEWGMYDHMTAFQALAYHQWLDYYYEKCH